MKKREIKFQVWDKKFGKMYTDGISVQADGSFYLDRSDGGDTIETAESESGELTLRQYTGIKDKNGKEVYEGDVIDSGSKRGSDGTAILYSVEWSADAMGWDLKQIGPFCLTGGIDSNKVVVIGNVHENPELLQR